MITITHTQTEDPTYDPILEIQLSDAGVSINIRMFDDLSAGVDVSLEDDSTWFSMSDKEVLALQAALNKAFPV